MGPAEALRLARTVPGRWVLMRGAFYAGWPLLRAVASAWRLTAVRSTRVIAVVGSFGKTTTARAVAAAVGSGREMGIASNQTGFLAVKVLAVRPGQARAVVEAGIHRPGQMEPYARMVRPDVTVVTSVGSEHRGSFRTLEATAAEKAGMAEAVGPGGAVVLNGDDPHVAAMARRCRAEVVTYGFGAGADVRVVAYRLEWPRGSRVRLKVFGRTLELRSGLVGRHMALPVAAALAVASVEGIPVEEAAEALAALRPAPGRLQPFELPSGAWCLRDDFKSPLETVELALDVLAEIPARRRIVVLGDVSEPPGSQGPIYRRIGARVAELADLGIFVGNRAETLAAGARRAGGRRESFRAAGTRVLDAVAMLGDTPAEGDVVLVKGRDTQRLERVALALAGRAVRCNIKLCRATNLPCERCPMLERGWPEDGS